MSLDELLTTPVTVASLAPETPRRAPSSVTVFTTRQIRNLGVQTVEELLNFVPGMQSARTASRSDFGLAVRGRGRVGVPNDVLFLINGRRLNEDFTGSALVFGRYLSAGNLERVEVIRGPGSALYGSNAFLAVVNMVTREDANQVELAVGSHQYREGRLALSGDAGPVQGSLYLQAFADQGESFVDPATGGSGNTRDPRSGRTLQGTVTVGPTRFDLRHAAYRVEDFYLFQITPAFAGNESWAEDTGLDVRHTLVASPERRLEVDLGARQVSAESLSRVAPGAVMAGVPAADTLAPFGPGAADFLGGTDVVLNERHGALRGDVRLGDHHLYAGFSYRETEMDTLANRNNYEATDFLARRPVRFYGAVRSTAPFGPEGEVRRVRSVYLQDRWAMTERLEATLGGRWDDYSDFGASFNPRLALVYEDVGPNTWKLLYGEAFRAPTVTELAARNGPVRVGNPDLKAEKVRTVELAWVRSGGGLQTTATAWYSRLSERIVDLPVVTTGQTTLVNGDDLHLSGVEVEAHARLGRNWVLRGTWSHTLNTGDGPSTTPRNMGSLIANYHRGRFNLNINGLYRDAADNAALGETLDGYWLVNTHVRYHRDPVVLVAGIDNLFDEDYATPARAAIPGGTPNRGRELRFAIEVPLGD